MLELVDENNNILRQPTEPFDFDQDTVDPQLLAKEMFRTMFVEQGIGLAGPQVNIPFSVFVMGNEDMSYAIFNPRIVEASETKVRMQEGCLSFPGLWLQVDRPEWIVAEFQDPLGNTHTKKFEGILARVFQHEYDHLQGQCFMEKVGKVSLMMAKERQRKILRKQKNGR